MRTEEEIRFRVRELVVAERDRRIAEAREKLPHRCIHNHRHALDARRDVLGEPNGRYNRIQDARHLPLSQTMGLCMLGSEDPEQWQGNICDDPIDAQRCPYFTPAKDAKTIVAEFMELVKEPSWVETNMPVVSALLWVAGPLAPIKDPSGVEGPETSEVEGPEFLQTTVESDDVRIENRLVKVEVVPADSGEAVRVEERAMNVTVLHYKPKESFWKRFLDWLGSSK